MKRKIYVAREVMIENRELNKTLKALGEAF
jgi:hypothetical protein